MRVLLCSAAIMVALAIAGCGSDSGSSRGASTTRSSTTSQRQQTILHYVTREARPRNPGPHPGARVDHLIVKDVRRGIGPAIQAGDRGIFEFIATNWVTGRPLEASWHRKRPFETQVEHNVVIDGWWQGIPGMRVGGRRQLIIPPALGFTTNPTLAEATTFFDIVLVEIRPQRPAGLEENSSQPHVSTQ
ncbi:MAG: FKBP-type peptidyl-prolyl cis-trans isomerase [Conexibacter sp.]